MLAHLSLDRRRKGSPFWKVGRPPLGLVPLDPAPAPASPASPASAASAVSATAACVSSIPRCERERATVSAAPLATTGAAAGRVGPPTRADRDFRRASFPPCVGSSDRLPGFTLRTMLLLWPLPLAPGEAPRPVAVASREAPLRRGPLKAFLVPWDPAFASPPPLDDPLFPAPRDLDPFLPVKPPLLMPSVGKDLTREDWDKARVWAEPWGSPPSFPILAASLPVFPPPLEAASWGGTFSEPAPASLGLEVEVEVEAGVARFQKERGEERLLVRAKANAEDRGEGALGERREGEGARDEAEAEAGAGVEAGVDAEEEVEAEVDAESEEEDAEDAGLCVGAWPRTACGSGGASVSLSLLDGPPSMPFSPWGIMAASLWRMRPRAQEP